MIELRNLKRKRSSMTRSRKVLTLGIIILTALIAQAAHADSVLGDPEYSTKPASMKLWRGVVNTATGWCELIRQPIVCTMEDGIVGVPVGIINGVVMTVVRTGAGIIEAVTFPVPLEEGVGYDSLMNPDYVWQAAE
jgi:putative exosortase-associated protein (TIGR04073 family)